MIKREDIIGQFQAISDSGNKYTIIEFQKIIDAGSHDDINAEIKGMKRLATSDGQAVNFKDSNTFEIVETSEIVRKI